MGTGSLLAVVLAIATMPAGRIVGEWEPGITSAEAGGPIVVDDYGVSGLGAYRLALDDGTVALAVCIQADVGHSLDARYEVDATIAVPAELAYLAWAYLSGAPDDAVAAAINVLAWRYTGAQRRGGGMVWRDGPVDVRALGVGHLVAVEQAVEALHVEAQARHGPWLLTADGAGRVRLHGPGGPIAGVVVHLEADGWAADVVTAADGVAAFDPPGDEVRASATGPGAGIALVAPGSQRLAVAGPAELVATVVPGSPPTTTVPPTTTTTTTTVPPTTSTTTSTTIPTPTTSSTSTTAATTTTLPTTSSPAITTAPPPTAPPPTMPPPTVPPDLPPHLPPTGGAGRDVARLGAWLFALGSLAICVARRRAQ
jgi:hypothetical protein